MLCPAGQHSWHWEDPSPLLVSVCLLCAAAFQQHTEQSCPCGCGCALQLPSHSSVGTSELCREICLCVLVLRDKRPLGRAHRSTMNSVTSAGSLCQTAANLVFSVFSPLFLTQGIVATCSAPAAVTRRCRFPASSSLSPAESASRATAACTRAAPALISNWTNPSLPHPIKGSSWAELCDLSGLRLEGRGVRSCCSVGRSSAVLLARGHLLFQLFPFPFCPIRVCVRVRACVCVYI